MRKSTPIICSAVALAAIGIANAEIAPISDYLVKQAKHEIPAGFSKIDLNNPSAVSTVKTTSKAPKRELTRQQTSLVLFEDFTNVPDGEFEQTGNIGLRAVTPIANYDCGNMMNPAYTPESGQWYGEWVYAGEGGTIIMQAYNPMAPAQLQLPLNDYSGDLILTMRVRPRKAFWGADNECGYVTSASGGTDISLCANIGGYGSYQLADSELGYGYPIAKIYPRDGWVETKTTFRNESANADGSLIIYLSDACEIDWIKVEDAGTHLAAPVVKGVKDFKENEITVEWDNVRRAYNYYLDLFYAKWTADKGVDENYDFESGIPADFTAGGATAANGEGIDGSNGVRIAEGEENAFTTPTYVANLEECGVKFIFNMTMSDEDIYEMPEPPMLMIEGLSDEGWRPVASAVVDGYWTPGNHYLTSNLSGDRFANQYKALRFYGVNTDDENYFVIDDVTPYAPRPYELDRVMDPDPESNYSQVDWATYKEYVDLGYYTEEDALEMYNSDFNYWYYTEYGDPCEYTFKDFIEPDKEYFWRVRSHRLETINGNGNTFVSSDIHHMLGVAAPTLQDAKDVSSNSYTACWKDVAKAQNYIVTNYKLSEIEEDTNDYVIFSETFAGLEGETSIDLFEPAPASLDGLTDMPGWTGEELSIGQNAIGTQYGGMINSPELGLVGNDKPYYLYFEAEGFEGETLIVQFNGLQNYAQIPFEAGDVISGTFEVPVAVEGESISFYTLNGYPFAIKAFEVTQNVKAGDRIRNFDSRKVVPAGTQQARFEGLEENGKYAYSVASLYHFQKENVTSIPDHLFNLVDLKEGSSVVYDKVEGIGVSAEVVARYTVDGLKAPENYKGVVIEKLSNGKTRKVVVK